MRALVALILAAQCLAAQADCVILLHGLWRSPGSMASLATALAEQGYTTVNLGYPSRSANVQALANQAIEPALDACPEGRTVHFVTHSLGGILVRQYLLTGRIERLGRVVMLGPPNQGSEVVDSLGDLWGFEWLNGPAGMQLGTGDTNLPNQLGPVAYDVAVIAGDRSINWILSLLIPGEDDGKVAVEKTMVAGMKAHLTLPVNHATMMNQPEVIESVLAYLKSGRWALPGGDES